MSPTTGRAFFMGINSIINWGKLLITLQGVHILSFSTLNRFCPLFFLHKALKMLNIRVLVFKTLN